MSITISRVCSQIYLLPYVKITHDKFLNGNYEFIIGWLNREIILTIK